MGRKSRQPERWLRGPESAAGGAEAHSENGEEQLSQVRPLLSCRERGETAAHDPGEDHPRAAAHPSESHADTNATRSSQGSAKAIKGAGAAARSISAVD